MKNTIPLIIAVLLGAAAVFAVSLWLTHVDILKIETRLPEAEWGGSARGTKGGLSPEKKRKKFHSLKTPVFIE